MTHTVRAFLLRLLGSAWFLPAVVVAGFVVAALALEQVEPHVGEWDVVYGGDADAARDILTTVAASIVTIAGLTISLTIVVLQLVSSQYTPRALTEVLLDRTTQVASGAFIGVFAYALLVLRTVREDQVPRLGVTLAIAAGLAALGLLLVFVHRVTQRIQVSHVADSIRRRTVAAVERHWHDAAGASAEAMPSAGGTAVEAQATGYVQALDPRLLAERLPDEVPAVDVLVAPGAFVTPGRPLALVYGDAGPSGDGAVRAAIHLASRRDLRDDAQYGLRQLADIALRALSPSLNDPTTAINCIHHMGAVLEEMARRPEPPAAVRLRDGGLVVRRPRQTFEEMLAPLEELVRATDDPRVHTALAEAVQAVAEVAAASGRPERAVACRALAGSAAQPASSRRST